MSRQAIYGVLIVLFLLWAIWSVRLSYKFVKWFSRAPLYLALGQVAFFASAGLVMVPLPNPWINALPMVLLSISMWFQGWAFLTIRRVRKEQEKIAAAPPRVG